MSIKQGGVRLFGKLFSKRATPKKFRLKTKSRIRRFFNRTFKKKRKFKADIPTSIKPRYQNKPKESNKSNESVIDSMNKYIAFIYNMSINNENINDRFDNYILNYINHGMLNMPNDQQINDLKQRIRENMNDMNDIYSNVLHLRNDDIDKFDTLFVFFNYIIPEADLNIPTADEIIGNTPNVKIYMNDVDNRYKPFNPHKRFHRFVGSFLDNQNRNQNSKRIDNSICYINRAIEYQTLYSNCIVVYKKSGIHNILRDIDYRKFYIVISDDLYPFEQHFISFGSNIIHELTFIKDAFEKNGVILIHPLLLLLIQDQSPTLWNNYVNTNTFGIDILDRIAILTLQQYAGIIRIIKNDTNIYTEDPRMISEELQNSYRILMNTFNIDIDALTNNYKNIKNIHKQDPYYINFLYLKDFKGYQERVFYDSKYESPNNIHTILRPWYSDIT